MAQSNKDRQKAYRARKRAARNATVTAAIHPAQSVTETAHPKDYIGIDGFQRMYIGEGREGPMYAMVIPAVGLADAPDANDDWSPVVYGQEQEEGQKPKAEEHSGS